MSDPVAEKSGFLCMYMSGHPDTLVAYAKWFGKVKEPISSAKMTAIDTKKITLSCTPRSKGQDFELVIPIEPPLKGYDDVKPRLLEMKALAQEGLGMIKAPKIDSFKFPFHDKNVFATGALVTFVTLAYFAPQDSSSFAGSILAPFVQPVYLLRGLIGQLPIKLTFWSLFVAHVLETLYAANLCRTHSTGFFVGAGYALSTFYFGFPIWGDLRLRIQNARIDSVMKVE